MGKKGILTLLLCACAMQVYADKKVIIKQDTVLELTNEATLMHDYGSYKLYRINDNMADQLSQNNNNISIAHDMDYLLFDAYRFNTQMEKLNIQEVTEYNLANPEGLQLIQFSGPVKQQWLDAITAEGIKLIHYIANNGYLVWANAQNRSTLNEMVNNQEFVQFNAPYLPKFKMGKSIIAKSNQATLFDEDINVVVQLTDSPLLMQSKALVESLTIKTEAPWQKVMKFHSTRITVKFSDIRKIVDMPDSFWVAEYFERTLSDEVQNQIMVADFNGDNSGPAMTGYADFLAAKGFPTTAASYPVVDVTDSGIGNGTTATGDPTFHEGGQLTNPTRVSYVTDCTTNGNGEAVGGHGHLNLNIVGGFESRVGFPFIDPNGYIRTQGINPYTRLAGTRIFGPNFDLGGCGGNDVGLLQSVQDDGAQIMSNSWGCSGCAGSYDDSSQAFDVAVRDADLTQAGNQQLIMLFSAGNSGPTAATVGTPGNGKNMITVGASENFRPEDEDGPWTDGCAVGPTGADNAMDVIGFSSRGPSPGGRIKPEVIGPGTHIHGTASTSPNADGTGTCDAFRPSGQTTIAASSGTSHSAPAVSGVASLAYYWLEAGRGNVVFDGGATAPSPALMKAFMMAHPTYLTGEGANGDLPSNSQGYGMPNMTLMFDDVQKYAHNQSHVFDNTGEQWTWVGSAADPSKPVRIAIAYTDQPGAVGTSPQVNNLDLSVETNGNTYLGNVFTDNFSIMGGIADVFNNYEAVFFDAGTANDLTITVSATNIAGDGIPNAGDATDQDFAIFCYNCAQIPTFTINPVPSSIEVCSPDDAVYDIEISSILGFTDDVTLTSMGVPIGSSADFSVNPVTPAGSSVFTISGISAANEGDHSITLTGTAGVEVKSRTVSLSVFEGIPAGPTLTAPADNASNVALTTEFTWDVITNANTYLLEVATDAAFVNVIISQTTNTNSYTPGSDFPSSSVLYWRVTSQSICGSSLSAVFSFTTQPLPGDCNIGDSQVDLIHYDFEAVDMIFTSGFEAAPPPPLPPGGNGSQGWVTANIVGAATWNLQSAIVGSGSQAYNSTDLNDTSDNVLTSPVISVPTGSGPYTLRFWNQQSMELSSAGCWDGGFLEISQNGGQFVQVANDKMINDPYDGPLGNGNAQQGKDAWCGDPQAGQVNSIDIDDFAGSDIQLRFRIATDGSVGRPDGWSIDDVKVTACEAPTP
ncbi:MAG: S8 family serine peptidase [Alcanivoracaceae bacterium]|nr:S8 family serine peptidase [Alcanivoracaceae bacterium]